MGQEWPAAESGALSVAMRAWDTLKEATIIFVTSTIVWAQVKQREGTETCPSAKIRFKIY